MSEEQTILPRFQSVAKFEDWADRQPDKWELHDGVAVAMAPERVDHVRIKYSVWAEFKRALREAGSVCEAIGDGLTVPGPGLRSFRPDVSVLCGERLGGDETRADRPVVLVEVLSPSTAEVDHGLKLASYFALPSVQHYLIVSSTDVRVLHHRRWHDGGLLTAICGLGPITLDPPGITVSVAAFYEGSDLAAPA